MTLKSAEQARLFSQAQKRDKITEVHYLDGLLNNYVNEVMKCLDATKVRVNVIFDENSTNQLQGRAYSNHLFNILYESGIALSTESDDSIITVEAEKPITLYENREELYDFLSSFQEPSSFNHSKGYSVVALDKNDEPIPWLSTYSSDLGYQKYLPDTDVVVPYVQSKVPITGRTTIIPEKEYFQGKEKDIIKRLLHQTIYAAENSGIWSILTDECKKRQIAFEKTLPPGQELRQHWRMKTHKYELVEYDPDIFRDLILFEDALAFYPKLSQKIEHDGKAYNLLTRMVIEVDPRGTSLEYTSKVFDELTKVINNLGLRGRRFHSGNKSPRIHMDISAEDVLENTPNILDNFPFLGYGANKLGTPELDYKAVIKGLENVIYINLWNRLKEHEFEKPRITKNKFNLDSEYALIDFPHSDSIAGGSPKKIVRLGPTERRILKEKYPYNPPRILDLPFTLNLCTALIYDSAPTSQEEIFDLCNVTSAAERFNNEERRLRMHMKNKLTTKQIITVLEKVDRRTQNQIRNLYVYPEEKFRKIYS